MAEIITLDVNGHAFSIQKKHLLQFKDSSLEAMFSGRHNTSKKDKRVMIRGRNTEIFKKLLVFL